MIINTFKNKMFPLSPDNDFSDAGRDKDESDDEHCTLRELETIPELSNFENQEETPADIPELECEESEAQRRNQRGQGLQILTPE